LGSPIIDPKITIRQLLNHTSGVFDWATHRQSPFIIPYREIDHTKVWTQDKILDKLGGKPYFSPGNGWRYSTTNYNLLRIVAEKVTGTSALIEIQNRFLGPLGLQHTLALGIDDPIPPHLEMAHSWIDVGGDDERQDISGDSQAWITSLSPHMMVASALDLARWCQSLYGGRVLGEAALKDMLDFHRPTPDEPPVTGYGLGTEEIAVRGLFQSYGHLGYHYGTMSAMLYLPKLKASVVVLTNENNHPFQYGVAFGLLAVILVRRLRPVLCFVLLLILAAVLWA
jgi:D-alanyl-D-alanine carboxypeptidase